MTQQDTEQARLTDQTHPESAEAEVYNSKQRSLPKGVSWILSILMFVYALYFLYAAGYQSLPGLEHRSIHLAGGFVFALLLFAPAKRLVNSGWALILDILFATATIGASVYVFSMFGTYADRVGLPATTSDIIFGLIVFAIMFEVARRVIGWAFPIVMAGFIVFALFGPQMPTPFTHSGFDLPRFMATFFYTLSGPYGEITQISADYILIFIIFAAFVLNSGAGDFFRNLTMIFIGKVRGGAGKIAVVASALMGMLTGSSMANVAASGSVTIPMMKRTGYRATFAGGVEACSSMGAQIMPPIMGGSIFIMVELIGRSYWDIASSAFLIGGLFFLGLFFIMDFEAAKNNLRGLRGEEIPQLWPLVKNGWYHLIPISTIVYLLAVQGVSPARAAFWGIIATIALMLLMQRFKDTPLRIAETMIKGVRDALMVISVVALASLTAGIVTVTGLGFNLSQILISFSGGNLLALLVVAAIASLIMGMGVPILVAYSVLAVLVAPALINLDVDPLAAHMFIFYFAVISSITPPVAPDAVVASGIAKASMFRIAGNAVRIGSVLYLLPFLFVYNEVLLLQGSFGSIVLASATAAVGIYSLACALQGMMLHTVFIGWPTRAVLGIAALGLIVPNISYSLASLATVILIHIIHYLRQGADSQEAPIQSGVRDSLAGEERNRSGIG